MPDERKPFKPSTITDNKFPFEKEDGTRNDFCPWAFSDAVQKVYADGGNLTAKADAIRQFLGYPTSADIASAVAKGEQKPPTLSLDCCDQLETAVIEYVSELPSVKKKQQLLQKP